MKNIISYSIKGIIATLIFIVLLIFSAMWYFSSGLPDYKKLSNYQPPVSSRVYADNGKLMSLLPEFKFTSMEDGIKNSVQWFIDNFDTCRK